MDTAVGAFFYAKIISVTGCCVDTGTAQQIKKAGYRTMSNSPVEMSISI